MTYVIEITHNRGVSYWHGDQSSDHTGFGALAIARKYRTYESAERDMGDIGVRHESKIYLGYIPEAMKIKEISDETKEIVPDPPVIRRYRRD